MMKFFKTVMAVIVGMIVVSVLFFVVMGAMIASAISNSEGMSADKAIKVKENSVLRVDLAHTIKEQNNTEDFNFTSANFKMVENLGLQNIVRTIEKAKTDDKIKGIYLPLSGMPNGFATTDVIRRSLLDFKESGKFIVAYGEYASQKAYYLASVADKVYINPEGLLEMRGIGTQLTFFKRMLDKLEAEVQVFKVGTFKSAIEPFVREDASEPNRKQLEYLLGGIKEDFIRNISESRGISAVTLENSINDLKIASAQDAVDLGLIDGAFYADQVVEDLSERLGIINNEDINFIDMNKYGATVKKNTPITKDQVAVVYAEGDIVSDKAPDQLSSEEFAEIIRKLRIDDDVKAIVLRVNSPGGSALASEVIWRELELAKKTKKIVVSMGNLAASGGYYISCGADYIFAEENTITGSIGVFGLVPNFETFLENKIGVTFDEVNLNTHASMNGVTKKFDALEHQVIQNGVERVYDTFTKRVAEGRNMHQDSVKVYAEGRVWTGEQAKEIGLVDEIGDLDAAIAYAVELSEVEEYRLKEFPKVKEPLEQFMEEFGIEEIKTKLIKAELGEDYKYYEQVKNIKSNFNTIQMRMPFDIEVE